MSTNITVVGNLTRDVELKNTPSGQILGRTAVAVSNRTKDAAGNWADAEPDYYEVSMWGDVASNAAVCLKKGVRVIITGRIKQERWEKDGQKHSLHTITADEIGPSLRWATVSGVEKRSGSGSGGGRPDIPIPDGPPAGVWPTPSGAAA